MKKILGLLPLLLVLACALPTEAPTGTPPNLHVTDSQGRDHGFTVEVATSDHAIQTGLQHREHLGEDEGMLFLFDSPGVWQFWMKDTLIPLDMLFIAPNGKVAKIHANAQPNDWTAVSSVNPVAAVLEIRGGRAKQLGITVGSTVTLPISEKPVGE